jgi:uncharacterized membrane protein
MSGSKDLQAVVLLVMLTLLFVLVPPLDTTFIRTALGIPMVLFLPGYALIAALFPKKSDLDGIERIALSFGLSIAVVPLIGLGLNFTPFGIRLIPILICLSIFTFAMCSIAFWRRSKLSSEESFSIPFGEMVSSLKGEIFNPKSLMDKVLTVILILSIIISILVLIYVIVTPKQGEKFTEFYILGENGKAEGYPTLLEVGNNSKVIAGIVNHEYIFTNYTMDIVLQNETLKRYSISLMQNSTWEEKVSFSPRISGKNMKLEFLLYKEENFSAPYRDLHLWVNSTE